MGAAALLGAAALGDGEEEDDNDDELLELELEDGVYDYYSD